MQCIAWRGTADSVVLLFFVLKKLALLLSSCSDGAYPVQEQGFVAFVGRTEPDFSRSCGFQALGFESEGTKKQKQ